MSLPPYFQLLSVFPNGAFMGRGKEMDYSFHYQMIRVLSLLDSTMMRLYRDGSALCFHWFPEGVPLSGSGLEEALSLPLPAMAVSESHWSGVFLKHPLLMPVEYVLLLLLPPKAYSHGSRNIWKTLLLRLLLSPQNSRLEKEAISSLQTFFKILKHFVMENSNVYKVKMKWTP